MKYRQQEVAAWLIIGADQSSSTKGHKIDHTPFFENTVKFLVMCQNALKKLRPLFFSRLSRELDLPPASRTSYHHNSCRGVAYYRAHKRQFQYIHFVFAWIWLLFKLCYKFDRTVTSQAEHHLLVLWLVKVYFRACQIRFLKVTVQSSTPVLQNFYACNFCVSNFLWWYSKYITIVSYNWQMNIVNIICW